MRLVTASSQGMRHVGYLYSSNSSAVLAFRHFESRTYQRFGWSIYKAIVFHLGPRLVVFVCVST